MVLLQESGGSGIFAYLVAAIRTPDGFAGSDALFLGDRIGQADVNIRDGMIHVRFKDVPEPSPLSDPPSRNRTVRARLDGFKLKEMELVAP